MAKTIRRLPPCPAYDIPGWESWLEDMGREGLVPAELGSGFCFLSFAQTTPAEYRYRLEPMSGRNREPDAEFLAMAEAAGWEYLGCRSSFFFYRTSDPNAPELHTEPETQALTLGYLKKWFRSGMLALLAELLLLGVLILPQLGWALVTFGSAYILSCLLMLAVMILERGIFLWRIFLLQRRLKAGQPMAHRKDWRRGSRAYQAGCLCSWLLLILMVLCCIRYHMTQLGFGEKSLADYPGQPPFVTLEELADGVEIDHIRNNGYRSWSDPLFPVCIYWLDGANVTWPDGEWTAGLQTVQYCEALTPWLAELVAKDYLAANRHRYDSAPGELTHLGVDFAAGYTSHYENGSAMTRAVIVEGSTVICIEFQMNTREFSTEYWLEQMAQRICDP